MSEQPVDGDIRETEYGREMFHSGAWKEQDCVCDVDYDGCIWHLQVTWPRPPQSGP